MKEINWQDITVYLAIYCSFRKIQPWSFCLNIQLMSCIWEDTKSRSRLQYINNTLQEDGQQMKVQKRPCKAAMNANLHDFSRTPSLVHWEAKTGPCNDLFISQWMPMCRFSVNGQSLQKWSKPQIPGAPGAS